MAEKPNSSSGIDGCKQTRKFVIYEDNYPNEVVVSLCDKGIFGPSNVQATIDNLVRESKQRFSTGMPNDLAKLLLSGLPGIPVALSGKRKGLALTVPFSGHGIAMVPMAYGVDEEKKTTIFVQAYINPNNPRNLSEPIAKLLQAIDRRLHEKNK